MGGWQRYETQIYHLASAAAVRRIGKQEALKKLAELTPRNERGRKRSTVNRLLMFLGTTIGGYVGWWAGDYIGFGLMGTFLVSSLGSMAGIYVVWRLMGDYLS